jgi:hypothetical protein
MFRHPLIRVGRWSTFAALLALCAVPPARASVPVDPPTFTTPTTIDNTYFPFVPGAVSVFNGKTDGDANVIVDLFLADTRSFATTGGDVECRELQETEFVAGKLEEISHNFFAQADDGSVYYFGETVDIYDDTGAIVSHEGSWLVGGPTLPGDPPETVSVTDPGLFMPATPEVGDVYMPEDAAPAAQEQDTVESVTDKQKTLAGKFTDVLRVHEFGALDGDVETKWYAPGVGVIRAKAKGEQVKLIATSLLPAGS